MPETRISWAEFCRVVRQTVAALPQQFQERLTNVVVEAVEAPTAKDLAHAVPGKSADSLLLGLFVGVPLTEQHYNDPQQNTIRIFRRPLQQISRNRRALIENIRATVIHELAHHFGFSEDDLAAFEAAQEKWLD